MGQSRYFQTPTMQDMSVADPRDPEKAEPAHYRTYNLPADFRGYASIDLLANIDWFEYAWQLGDRMDRLANRFFGDDQYWWVIALVNNVQYVFSVQVGTVLRIPLNVNDILSKLELI
jgi:hypothetical protein